eukprot:3686331-Rhodomonas_salina.1
MSVGGYLLVFLQADHASGSSTRDLSTAHRVAAYALSVPHICTAHRVAAYALSVPHTAQRLRSRIRSRIAYAGTGHRRSMINSRSLGVHRTIGEEAYPCSGPIEMYRTWPGGTLVPDIA